jgi:putative membrane protein insertion efficiency factor
VGRGKIRRAIVAAVLLLVVFVALDDVLARAAVFGIDQYRARISPRFRGMIACRFKPTCSAYGREAMREYGFARGSVKTIARIARCGPWTPMGTVDRP